jgi:hypothetical protein
MIHQRISPLFLVPLLVAACGGGDADAGSYDPDRAPHIADQKPPLSGSQPPLSDSPPPNSTQLPGGSTETPGGEPGGGGDGSCLSVCNKVVNSQCELEGTADCEAGCQELEAQECSTELLALFDCAYSLGFCPDESNEQQVAQACSKQALAYATCANNDNDGL